MNGSEQLFYILFQTVRHREATLDLELAPLGLTAARWRALGIIRRVERCSMSELSRYSTVDRTTLTRSVDQLVQEGLVDRHVPPKDRRMVILTLTPAGEEILSRSAARLIKLDQATLKEAPKAIHRELARTMETILRSMIADPAEAEAVIKFSHSVQVSKADP